VLYDGRAAVVGPRDRGTLERRATVVVTPAAVERVPRRHTLTTRRVDAARRHRHAPYLHRSHVVVTVYTVPVTTVLPLVLISFSPRPPYHCGNFAIFRYRFSVV